MSVYAAVLFYFGLYSSTLLYVCACTPSGSSLFWDFVIELWSVDGSAERRYWQSVSLSSNPSNLIFAVMASPMLVAGVYVGITEDTTTASLRHAFGRLVQAAALPVADGRTAADGC